MPTVANGIDFEWDIGRARGENFEIEWRSGGGAILRGLGFVNHANMGSYREAIQAFKDGQDPTPNIEAHRQQGRIKYGSGVNAEQTFPKHVRAFARAGWNEGDSESFAYTEVNNTVSAGIDVAGDGWRREHDKLGVAFVTNGLSDPHREYLRLGGLGFLLGDGTLTYGRESIIETYYTARLWRGLSASGGLQYLVHPGYNRDRGPVTVVAARVHIDL
jgi:high affinity Mn2+ porin